MKNILILILFVLLVTNTSTSQNRGYDKSGLNVFEEPKINNDTIKQVNFKLGGSFTQSYQTLQHSNNAEENFVGFPRVDQNKLVGIEPGFNTANANMYFNIFLDRGIYLNMALYLSSRYHNETWVKGGYIVFNRIPFLDNKLVNKIMQYTTIKAGHMEINYGDAHFRRTDNGNSIYNPFVENYILDAFTTEIGAEINVQHNGFLGVAAITNGQMRGNIEKVNPIAGGSSGKRNPAFIFKLGYDNDLSDALRLRVTGSCYYTKGSVNNTLYGGDRTGSHYFGVMENSLLNTSGTSFSGRYNPDFSDEVRSVMGNIFLKFKGLEWFTTLENSKGKSLTEINPRNASQYATDLVYRFGKKENFWFGARYNIIYANVFNFSDIGIDRYALSTGWFVTKNIVAKAEYVNQNYINFPASNRYSHGNFNGFVFEAILGF